MKELNKISDEDLIKELEKRKQKEKEEIAKVPFLKRTKEISYGVMILILFVGYIAGKL